MGKFVDEVMFQALAQVEEVRKKALKEAVPIVKKDMKVKVCDRAVMEYYNEYSPTRYKRTYSLYNLFKTYARQDGQTLTVWAEYDNSRLPDYRSNSKFHQSGGAWIPRLSDEFDVNSSNNGIPEKDWIFDQFWEGIHPRYYINRQMSEWIGETVVEDASYHFESAASRLQKYADGYEDRVREIIYDKMLEQL